MEMPTILMTRLHVQLCVPTNVGTLCYNAIKLINGHAETCSLPQSLLALIRQLAEETIPCHRIF